MKERTIMSKKKPVISAKRLEILGRIVQDELLRRNVRNLCPMDCEASVIAVLKELGIKVGTKATP